MRLEGAKLYRTLGVTEDATYEEISQKTEELVVKYAGDIKQRTRVQVTKDKIMEVSERQKGGEGGKEMEDNKRREERA